MFEKKIKNFFNSVEVCGELPVKEKIDKRILIPMEIAAGVVCVLAGALVAILLMDKIGEEEADEKKEKN
jgi:hypothetical protein